jgi:multicomponent Na+:H+ antiporter subunit B
VSDPEGSTRHEGTTTAGPGSTPTEPGDDTLAATFTEGDTTVVARTVVRTVVPLIVIVSISLLFQGHNLPGGGFIGGVLTATAFVLMFVVYGLDFVRVEVFDHEVSHDPDDEAAGRSIVGAYRRVFSLGLALAAGSGLVPVLAGALDDAPLPFLTQAVAFVELPIYDELEVASAFAFDIGVYLVVVGAILTVIGRVGQE